MSTPVPEPAEGTGRSTGAQRRFAPHRTAVTPDGAPEPAAWARLSDRTRLPMVLLAVFGAGMLGTAARLLLDAAIPPGPAGIPVSTLLINTAGSLALGLVVATIPRSSPEWLRAGVTTGLLGSFTTFSALTVATVELSGSGEILPAAALLILSVAAGLGAAVAGMAMGAGMARRRA